MAKPMTVKKLKKKFENLPDHLLVVFETNEISDTSWSADKVESRFDSFCVIKSVGKEGSLKVVPAGNQFPGRYSPSRYGMPR